MNLEKYLLNIKKTVLIFYLGRSGSMFFSGLLDNHEQIISGDFYRDKQILDLFRQKLGNKKYFEKKYIKTMLHSDLIKIFQDKNYTGRQQWQAMTMRNS